MEIISSSKAVDELDRIIQIRAKPISANTFPQILIPAESPAAGFRNGWSRAMIAPARKCHDTLRALSSPR